MSEAFHKMCLHHQALDDKEPDDVNTFYEKLCSF